MMGNFPRNWVTDGWEMESPTQKAAPEREIVGSFIRFLFGQGGDQRIRSHHPEVQGFATLE